jgi:hypothetical protein
VATVTINVPIDFMQHVRQFMVNVQRMQTLTNQFVQTTQQQAHTQTSIVQGVHSTLSSRFRHLNMILNKLSSVLSRTIGTIIRSMGSLGTVLMRGASILATTLGPIISIAVSTITTIGTIAITIAGLAARFAKWIWNKIVDLADNVLQDYLEASGLGTTVGGLRTFRATFGNLIGTEVLRQTALGRASVSSKQAIALDALKIKATNDTTEMAIEIALAVQEFMKHQTAGLELQMAEANLLTSYFDPKRLILLKEADREELLALKAMYQKYKPLIEITDKARKGWMRFSKEVEATKARIMSVIGEKLANDTEFVQALKKLSKSLASFIRIFVDLPISKYIIKRIGEYLEQFAKWLAKPETKQALIDFASKFKDMLKLIRDAISILKKILQDAGVIPTRAVRTIGEGRRALARRIGIDRPSGTTVFRPGIRIPGRPAPPTMPAQPGVTIFRPAQPARPAEPAVPSRPAIPGTTIFRPAHPGEQAAPGRPGIQIPDRPAPVARPIRPSAPGHPRIQIPGRPAPIPRTGRAPSGPTPLRAPKTAAEAPETIEAATKGGFVRGAGTIDRSQFVKEMQDKPWLRQRAMEIAANEEGTNQQGTQQIIESAMNRAQVRGTSLEKQLKWTSEGGYYDDARGHGRAVATAASPQGQKILGRSVDNALGGSNAAEYATDNSSGDLAAREARTGKFKYIKKSPGGDTLFSPGSAEPNLVPKFENWKEKQQARQGKGGVGGFTAKDIQEMDGPTASSPSTAPQAQVAPDVVPPRKERLSTVGNYRLGGDQRRADLLKAGAAASRNLPPGWKVEAYSGQRDGPNQGPHAHSGAIDFRLIPPGKTFEQMKGADYQSPENFAVYEKFAQDTHLSLQKINPELAQQHRWGGYFSGPIGAGGKYGAMDLMHQDFAGGNSRMAAGQWETGLHPGWQRAWGVGEHSSGIAERARNNAVNAVRASSSADKPPAWPEQGAEPWDKSTGIHIRPNDHPINNVKVDNRSDDDVSHAKTSSNNDDGSRQPAPSEPVQDITPLANLNYGQHRGSSRYRKGGIYEYGVDKPSSTYGDFRRSEDIEDRRMQRANIRYAFGEKESQISRSVRLSEEFAPSKLGAEAGMADILRMEQKKTISEGNKAYLQGQIDEYEATRRKPEAVRSSPDREMSDMPADL